jgi:hypothetical protein
MRYEVTVRIRRIVVDTVDLILDAENNDEAFDKIEGVLSEYPQGHEVKGVHYCLTRDRWQEDAEILDANLTENLA